VPWNEFLLPLLAGYVFIHTFYLTKFSAQRYDGYRLLMQSAVVGVILFVVARFAVLLFHQIPLGIKLQSWLHTEGVAYPLVGTGITALVLAGGVAMLGNLVIGTKRAKGIVVKYHENGFLRLFHKAVTETRVVSVTLESKKVYIGYVLRTPDLTPRQQFVGVLPLLSGYRDKDTLQLRITTNYARVIYAEGYVPEDFEVTFCLDDVASASLFDAKAYPLFGDIESISEKQNTEALPPAMPE
jgi:hypothetical protein